MATEKKTSNGPEINWPKEFPELKLIDNALRCGICYEYIKTCMVTQCAHSYCSICIRRSLLYKTACPICFEETFETNLRNNRVLDTVIELFLTIKDKLIKYLRIAAIHFDCKEELQPPLSQNLTTNRHSPVDATPKRDIKNASSVKKAKLNLSCTPSTSSGNKKSDISKRLEDILGSPATKGLLNSEVVCVDSSSENDFPKVPTVPPMFLQSKVETYPKVVDQPAVACPVCDVNIPERNINSHLDNCLANVDKAPVKSPIKVAEKRKPLPKMVWCFMMEKDLRKKLKEYGLNTHGDKKILISRLQRYILLYNSECDKDNPRPVSEIIRQLEREEKQAQLPHQQRLAVSKRNRDPKILEEENKKYIQENKDSFKKLIETMKEREGRNIKPPSRPANRILSDDEDDSIAKKKNKELPKISDNSQYIEENPSTSKYERETINLSDSNDDNDIAPSSPILGSCMPDNKQPLNGFSSDSSEDIFIPTNNRLSENNKSTLNVTKVPVDNLEKFHKSPETESCSEMLSNSLEASSFDQPLPSCIISTRSDDSDDSISLLINDNTNDEDFLNNATENFTEDLQNCNSQLNDPDFVVDTEDQFEIETCNDVVLAPRRKSKRKLKSPVSADYHQNPSPRRTRRRVNK